MRALFVLAAALLLPLASAGVADTCVVDAEGEVPVEAPAGTFYVWLQPCEDCVSLWVHEESNGIDGLQVEVFWQEGMVCYPPGTQPDMLIF